MTSDHQPEFLTLREFAELVRVSHSSALSLVRSGDVPAIDVSTRPAARSRYIIPRAAADDWLQSRAVTPITPAPLRRRTRRPSNVPQHWPED